MKARLRILIIDDSQDDTALIVRELQRADYEVSHERVESEPALKHALGREHWDAVLCDFTMPDFSGKAALRIVKEMDDDLPFIYVSGTIGEDVAVEAMKSGAHDYVMKTNLKRLAPAVERELREAELRKKTRQLETDREQLVKELRVALTEVKRLSGLLPICAGCKKIRDDHDEWQPIEVYIQARSEAKFSHSLCPECLRHLYESPDAGDKTRD